MHSEAWHYLNRSFGDCSRILWACFGSGCHQGFGCGSLGSQEGAGSLGLASCHLQSDCFGGHSARQRYGAGSGGARSFVGLKGAASA